MDVVDREECSKNTTVSSFRMYFSAYALFGTNVDLDFLQSSVSFCIELSVLYKNVKASY